MFMVSINRTISISLSIYLDIFLLPACVSQLVVFPDITFITKELSILLEIVS